MTLHLKWNNNPEVMRQVKCVHTEAAKYKVDTMLTKDKLYDVINETEEFIFVIDNSNRVGGFYKEYFAEVE
ncbi:MAG TPA: DUF6501 family protein [Virgibacillus sp.]|nr:DUF6501 family protein [Virgibacillus sp.]HLR68845.1 DUF6501 family protein [Virgibacillus sp.]